MKLLQLSCRAFGKMTVLTGFQHSVIHWRDLTEKKQCFYCTSEFLKVYPSTLGIRPVLPVSFLLIQLLCCYFIEHL